MPTYAVGDIHGCFHSLQALLDKIAFSDHDTLWCVGDLVNRGGHDLAALRLLYSIRDRVVIVLGNHDLHMLACAYGHRKLRKNDTFAPVLTAEDSDELLSWVRHCPLIHRDRKLGFAMVHAGIPAIWDLDEACARASEVECALRAAEPDTFFANMYGNTPEQWHDELSGHARIRCITNYLTRMRFCSPTSALEFDSKAGPEAPPEGYLPWFRHPNHRCANDTVLFGHWAAMAGNSGVKNFIGLDTGCVWGGSLTAMRLEDGQRFSVPNMDENMDENMD